MKPQFNNMLVGLVLGILLTAGVAAVVQPSAGPLGRFQVVTSHGTHHPAAYVIDTITGQVWDHQSNEFKKPKL